jgi:Family of unknown function (DUF6356)
MRNLLRESRTHLHSVNESYFDHAKFALVFSCQCFKASAMAFMHSLVPGIFQASTGDTVRRLYDKLEHQQRAPNADWE